MWTLIVVALLHGNPQPQAVIVQDFDSEAACQVEKWKAIEIGGRQAQAVSCIREFDI